MLKISMLTLILATSSLSTTQRDLKAPVIISDKSIFMEENNKKVTDIKIDNCAVVNYSIAGGLDENDFTIDKTTGELRFKNIPNYEIPNDKNKNNTYELTIKIENKKGYSSTKDFIVTVLDEVE